MCSSCFEYFAHLSSVKSNSTIIFTRVDCFKEGSLPKNTNYGLHFLRKVKQTLKIYSYTFALICISCTFENTLLEAQQQD